MRGLYYVIFKAGDGSKNAAFIPGLNSEDAEKTFYKLYGDKCKIIKMIKTGLR